MAAMQCDVCGERLTMDVSGSFAICDFCGIKHPKERLMRKVSGINENVSAAEKVQEYTNIPKTETFESQNIPDIGFQEENVGAAESVTFASIEPEPVVSNIPEPAAIQPEPVVSSIPEPAAIQPEPVVSNIPEPTAIRPEPVISNIPEAPIMGNMDIGMEIGDGPELSTGIVEKPGNQVDLDGMSTAERAEYEKKASRIKELNDELKEFEEIYEANKNKFLGEGLKRKNYSETKIKEIREKLEELGA